MLPAQLEDGQHQGVEEGARPALDELPVEVAAPAVEAGGDNISEFFWLKLEIPLTG